MSAGNWIPYDQAMQSTLSGAINWASTTLKVALFTSSYALAQTTDALYSGITGEASGAGYTAGGNTVTTSSVATSSGTTTATCSAIPSWTSATIAAKYAVLYDSSTSKLLAHCLLDSGGATISSTSGTFAISAYSVAVTHNAT